MCWVIQPRSISSLTAAEAVPYLGLNGARQTCRMQNSAEALFSVALTWSCARSSYSTSLRLYASMAFMRSGLFIPWVTLCSCRALMIADVSYDRRHVRTWTPCLNAVHEATLLNCFAVVFACFPARIDIHYIADHCDIISLCQLHAAAAVGIGIYWMILDIAVIVWDPDFFGNSFVYFDNHPFEAIFGEKMREAVMGPNFHRCWQIMLRHSGAQAETKTFQ